MEPQPLTGKAVKIYFENRGEYYFPKEDIRSAVNWLKEKLENESRSNVKGSEGIRYPVDFYRVMRLIDEAFADVIPFLGIRRLNDLRECNRIWWICEPLQCGGAVAYATITPTGEVLPCHL